MKKKNLDNEEDRRWRVTGGPHRCNIPLPSICPDCGGSGIISMENGEDMECINCQGTGEVWEN